MGLHQFVYFVLFGEIQLGNSLIFFSASDFFADFKYFYFRSVGYITHIN